MHRILFISNGHGEDSIAAKIIHRLRFTITSPSPEIHAWPMVGEGQAYRKLGIPLTGVSNLLPSCGFATLSLKLLIKDLKEGWIATHYRQVKAAIQMKKKYSMIVAVGDIVPIAAAVLARTPFLFIGCAKSSYYTLWAGYTRLEKRLLRKYCTLTFPRDRLTIKELDRAKVPNEYAGNPMMDDLQVSEIPLPIPPITQKGKGKIIGVLPGSRTDMEQNAIHLLKVIEAYREHSPGEPAYFLFAVTDDFNVHTISENIRDRTGETAKTETLQWHQEPITEKDQHQGISLKLITFTSKPGTLNTHAWFIKGKLADVLDQSTIVVGVAGTANEQAVGLGKPLITYPTQGVMGPRYVNMKMQFFGPSALKVSPEPQKVAQAVIALLADKERQKQMIKAGKERMGEPGASLAIAKKIVEELTLNTIHPHSNHHQTGKEPGTGNP